MFEVFAIEAGPVEEAVAPLKIEAMDRAERDAGEYIEEVRADLEEHGWDINAAAPYPYGMSGFSSTYSLARYKHNNYHAVTIEDPSLGYQRRGIKDPLIVVMDETRIQHFIDRRVMEAAEHYEAFVAKLVKKIGSCLSASLDGSHVWSHSILTVMKTKGITERWKTQQIVNVSKFGKLFNQWPTRKVK